MITSSDLRENIKTVRDRIATAAKNANRDPDEITLIAVGKTHPAETLIPAIQSGLIHFGENRIQESEEKIPQLDEYDITWHLIGHLQRNKAAEAIELFDEFHALDSRRLAKRLQNQLEKINQKQFPSFIQVNVSGEESKYGLNPQQLEPLLEMIAEECPRLSVKGLMTIAPWTDDPKTLHQTFHNLRELRDKYRTFNATNIDLKSLSMGMTNDFEIAIEEGATHLRIGRAIFGERQQH